MRKCFVDAGLSAPSWQPRSSRQKTQEREQKRSKGWGRRWWLPGQVVPRAGGRRRGAGPVRPLCPSCPRHARWWLRSHLCSVQAPPEAAPGSEVFLKKVQQCDFIVLTGLGAADAVSLIGVDLGAKRRQAGGTEDPAPQTSPSESGSQHLPSGPWSHPRHPGKRCCSGTEGSRFEPPSTDNLLGK